MRIIETALFTKQRDSIIHYIAQDNVQAALKFAKQLKDDINLLVTFPGQYQQSKYTNSQNIHDMVFNGYTIIYKVNPETIEILQIFNQNLPEKLCN